MGTRRIGFKAASVIISTIGIVNGIGSVLVAKQIMDKKIDRGTKLWKKVCIRSAGYTVACGAALIGTYKVIDFAVGVASTAVVLTKKSK